MGYEIKLIIGKSGMEGPEFERDKSKPFKDGSGFEYKTDKRGQPVKTGRTGVYFSEYARLDLCKLGYQEDALNKLISKTHETGRKSKSLRFYYVYKGDIQESDDCYGDSLWPVPIREVLDALKKSHPKGKDSYRRTDWAIDLLSSMVDDSEGLEVIFYGH